MNGELIPDMFDAEAWKKRQRAFNPMTAVYGQGPTWAICGTCELCLRWESGSGRTFFKCSLRKNTHGSATDIRARWKGCGRYRPTNDAVVKAAANGHDDALAMAMAV